MQILPSDLDTLRSLADIKSDDTRCVLSVYFPGSQAEEPLALPLGDVPERMLETDRLSDDEREHRDRNIERWREATTDLALPDAPGWLAVVSWMTDQVCAIPLPKPPQVAAYLDNSPFLYPAGRLIDEFAPYAVLFADHSRAVLYEAILGDLVEHDRVRGDIKNHVKKGGWSQARYERRRDQEIHIFCERITERLRRLIDEEELDRIVLAGDERLLGELEEHLEDRYREMIVTRLPVDDASDTDSLFEDSLEAAFAEEQRLERRLLEQIRAAKAADDKAVLGPNGVLDALKAHRVSRLLIGPMEDTRFWRCHACASFGIGNAESCRDCGSEDVFEQSAANEFTDLAFEGGSSVQFTTAPIQEVGGVAALLRW